MGPEINQSDKKTVADQCYHCFGFGHMAADCQGPDPSRSCGRHVKEGHTAGPCSKKPQCYLYAARKDKPRDDHILRTTHYAAFCEAASKRKLSRGRV